MLLVAMLAIMVLIAAAMAKDNHNKNNDNHFVRNFDRFDNNRFDNGFQDFEQEADSGEVERSITAEEVVKTLATLFAHRGEPGITPKWRTILAYATSTSSIVACS
jgi:hypothetical protein